jgi:hypothetical protein
MPISLPYVGSYCSTAVRLLTRSTVRSWTVTKICLNPRGRDFRQSATEFEVDSAAILQAADRYREDRSLEIVAIHRAEALARSCFISTEDPNTGGDGSSFRLLRSHPDLMESIPTSSTCLFPVQ